MALHIRVYCGSVPHITGSVALDGGNWDWDSWDFGGAQLEFHLIFDI